MVILCKLSDIFLRTVFSDLSLRKPYYNGSTGKNYYKVFILDENLVSGLHIRKWED